MLQQTRPPSPLPELLVARPRGCEILLVSFPYYYDLFRKYLKDGHLVDASDLISEIRLVKSPAEVAYMRRAAEIMDCAVRAGFDGLRPGVRECDIHGIVTHAMYTSGGGPPAVAPPIASGPNLISQTFGAATGRSVLAGEPFMLEVGAQYRRYHSVCMRMAFLGEPPSKVRAMHDAILCAIDQGFRHIKSGVPASEVARRVLAGFEDRGYSRRGMQVGYGIGLGYPRRG